MDTLELYLKKKAEKKINAIGKYSPLNYFSVGKVHVSTGSLDLAFDKKIFPYSVTLLGEDITLSISSEVLLAYRDKGLFYLDSDHFLPLHPNSNLVLSDKDNFRLEGGNMFTEIYHVLQSCEPWEFSEGLW